MMVSLVLVLALLPQESEKIVLDLGGGVKMEFVRIKAGKFTMGDKEFDDATPHEVTISKDYWMQTTETTQAQWKSLMGRNPSFPEQAASPADNVKWEDCQKFLKKLNEKAKEQLKGKTAGLPTEAQWEYACRAGGKGKWCFGDDEEKLGEYGWCYEGSTQPLHPVGRKKPNAWGLYDMHGNVCEWCDDWYGDYPSKAVTDPTGPAKGRTHVLRGGSLVWDEGNARSAYRCISVPGVNGNYYLGLRVALR